VLFSTGRFGWAVSEEARPAENPRRNVVAFVDVHVIPMNRQEILSNQTVVVREGRIMQVGPVGEVEVPEDSHRVDAHHEFLVPGLMDMHVHISSEPELSLYIGYGVTTVRDLFGSHEHLAMRAKVAMGDLLGPRMYVAGPIVDGSPPAWPEAWR